MADERDSGGLRVGQPDPDRLDEEPLGAEDTEPAAPKSHRRAKPARDHWWATWFGRAAVLLFGALLLGTAFIAAYVGALHEPRPRHVPIAVTSGDGTARALLTAVGRDSDYLAPKVYPSARQASDALARREVYGVLASDGTGFNLTVASAVGPGVADLISQTVTAATAAVNAPLTVEDVRPLAAEDPRGLTPFYLVVGWMLGGYLAATVLAIVLGTVPKDLDRLGLRLAAFGLFALVLGLAGALVVGPGYGIWPHHVLGLWLTGTLIVFVGALITAALEAWVGLVGTGLAMILLFILGNPGSGGVYPAEFLPTFFRGMPRWIPSGLATDLVRGVEYFDRKATGWPITGLVLWALVGIVGVSLATLVPGRRARRG